MTYWKIPMHLGTEINLRHIHDHESDFYFFFVIRYTVNYTDQIQEHKLYSISQITQSSETDIH